MHYSEILPGRSVVGLTPLDVRHLLSAAIAQGATGLAITTSAGVVGSVHASMCASVISPLGVASSGPVCWLRTGTLPYLAWVSLHAWAHWLGTNPETVGEFISAGRSMPCVGSHVGDLSAADIALAMEYATVRGFGGVEFDIDADGYLTGAHIVDGVGLYELETTVAGVTVGVGVPADDVLLSMQLSVLATGLEGKP